ncbi:MAG: SirB2 family protein [Pseudomonadota bacterium]|nr:SirB2 family protein [Pseudomonadota bacterium]
MIEFYPQIKSAHIHLVLLSISLFALRGGFALFGARWPRLALLRYTSYTIDAFLLTFGVMLITMLPGAVFANGWLWLKLALVAVYIVLGICAMRERLPRWQRSALYLAALLVVVWAWGIARLHHPLGWLWLLG